MNQTMRILRRVGLILGLPIVLIALWWLLTLGPVNFYVPKPATLLQKLVEVWVNPPQVGPSAGQQPKIVTDLLPSIGRLLLGLFVAITLGVVLGVLIGAIRWLRQLTEPLLDFFRAIPPPVLIPVLLLILGISDQTRVTVIVLGAIWPILLNTIEGVRSVDPVLDDSTRSYRISGWSRLWHMVLPSASPQIMAGIRQSLSIGLILMVISEMVGALNGLGFTILQFQRSFKVPEMWSGILVLGLIGLSLSFVFSAVERRVLRWYHGLKQVEHAG